MWVSDNPMFMYAGEYDDVDDAKADLGRSRSSTASIS
jgi:hypothetical protein